VHPLLTLGRPTRVRRMGGVREWVLSDLNGELDSDLFGGRDCLAKGSIGTFNPGGVMVELM